MHLHVNENDTYSSILQDNILTDHSHVAAQHNSHRVPTFPPSAGFSSLRNRDTPILPHPKPLPSPDTVIELDDDGEEAASKHDVIEISSDSDIAGHDNEDEEMVVDDMLVSIRIIRHGDILVSSSLI